jgi:hypothetical protein
MPNYQVGEHKVDHPPLFACREHKQFLRLNAPFVEELCTWASDMVPSNLSEIAAPMVGGRADAFKLPDYLIPPRVLVWNPDGLKGPLGLPFTLVFIDKRFFGIPASYLTYERFEGCDECAANPPPPEPARASYPTPAPPAASSLAGSGVRKPAAPARPLTPAPQRPGGTSHITTPSGSTPVAQPRPPSGSHPAVKGAPTPAPTPAARPRPTPGADKPRPKTP